MRIKYRNLKFCLKNIQFYLIFNNWEHAKTRHNLYQLKEKLIWFSFVKFLGISLRNIVT